MIIHEKYPTASSSNLYSYNYKFDGAVLALEIREENVAITAFS